MSRTLSMAMMAAMYAQETGEVFVKLLTIDVPASPSLYLTDNSENVTSNGREYISFPFDLQLPTDEAGNISEARLTIDNVSRALVDDIRTLSGPLRLTLQIALASEPDTIVEVFTDYLLVEVSYDSLAISGALSQENFLREPFPKDHMTPAITPGIF